MRERQFCKFLLICSVVVLGTSIGLFILFSQNSDTRNLISIINSKSASNQTAILEKMIDWQGQGTISWGLGFLASITVFFTILLTLRQAIEKSEQTQVTSKIDSFLKGLVVLFLFVSVYSVFELLRYYRIVAALQNLFQNLTNVEVPKGLLFDLITKWNGGEWGMVIVSGIGFIYLSISYFFPKTKKEVTAVKIMKKEAKNTEELRVPLSKWFYYSLVLVGLFFTLIFLLYETTLGNEMATRFLPTSASLIVTFGIFTIFFELREDLEWKKVEKRVRRRIGKQIHGLFVDLSSLCEVDRVLVGDDIQNDDAWKELNRKQLKQMSEKIILNDSIKEILEKRDLAVGYATLFDLKRARLSEIEGKYLRFFDPTLRGSLMDIQDYLADLRFEFKVPSSNQARFEKTLSTIFENLVKEIIRIREKEIDIGF
jgi:hypothetical protein